ncbi:MAG: hypothetical protein GMKNLPBB_01876 [Myxococcota bacterium]|nr:hypothetical protein [Myxococcota bacterium]
MKALFAHTAAAALLFAACTTEGVKTDLKGQDLSLTFLHTSDIHSRLVPYDFSPGATDRALGLLPENAPFGGAARMATVLKRERARASRVVHLDSGDCFQGGPIYNLFSGEAEIRFLGMVGLDAAVIGNHEFDKGVQILSEMYTMHRGFPVLAANYLFDNTITRRSNLGDFTRPYVILNKDGLRIGVIGMANISSLNSIVEGGNSLGVTPLEGVSIVRDYVQLLRPMVDLIVVVSHLGLNDDREIIRRVPDIDVYLGGHLHIVLNPPEVIKDPWGRDVILSHSGAFAKYVGRLDTVIRLDNPLKDKGGKPVEIDGRPVYQRVLSHKYRIIPVDSRVPDDGAIANMLEPFLFELNQRINLEERFAYAPGMVRRFGDNGGDSQLGNLVAEAMRARRRVEADFGMTNSLGIRADLQAGAITREEMFEVFPFENSLTSIFLSGREVQDLMNFVVERSSERGCSTQAQVAGIKFVMNCVTQKAENITIGGQPLNLNGSYKAAVNDYIAGGGSGFRILQRNTTKFNTGISLRETLIDHMSRLPACRKEDFAQESEWRSYLCESARREDYHLKDCDGGELQSYLTGERLPLGELLCGRSNFRTPEAYCAYVKNCDRPERSALPECSQLEPSRYDLLPCVKGFEDERIERITQ